MSQQPKPVGSVYDPSLGVFRPDKRAHEARTPAPPVPKQPPTLKNHY